MELKLSKRGPIKVVGVAGLVDKTEKGANEASAAIEKGMTRRLTKLGIAARGKSRCLR